MSGTGPSESPLIEGEDFYWDDDGFMVFTAAYLKKRGYCCHQGCRHCPYEDPEDSDSDAMAQSR